MQPASLGGIEASQSPEAISAGPERHSARSITLLLCGVCTVLFVAIATYADQHSWDGLAAWGYLPPQRVWDGAYWGLISSAFVHLALWHVAFNVYWLWVLGGPVERTLGSRTYLGVVLGSAVVSSSVELGVSGSTGHGASGVVYALFGLMWAARKTVPAFGQALGEKTAPLFWTWLVGCILATRAGIAEVANGAHIGGLVFGLLTARWLVPTTHRRTLAVVGTGLLVVLSLIPLFWSPWSSTWVGYKAYQAHLAGNHEAAIAGYRRSITLGGDRLWALENLALAYHSRGAEREYAATLSEIRAVDTEVAAKVEAQVKESPDPGSEGKE